MKPIVGEWVKKAEGDFGVMAGELRRRKSPCFDAICFHAQQCAEKYLKARLAQAGVPVEKVHSLTALLDQVLPLEPLWEAHRADLAHLSAYAVAYRYPGETADRGEAKDAAARCRRFRAAARLALRL
jgi:HEPN domain-containing protein